MAVIRNKWIQEEGIRLSINGERQNKEHAVANAPLSPYAQTYLFIHRQQLELLLLRCLPSIEPNEPSIHPGSQVEPRQASKAVNQYESIIAVAVIDNNKLFLDSQQLTSGGRDPRS